MGASLPGPDPGVTLAIDLKDGVDVACGCSGEKICRLGGIRPCVFVNVGVRHRRQVGQVQGSSSPRINERMPTMLEGMVVFVAVEAKPPVFSEDISAR